MKRTLLYLFTWIFFCSYTTPIPTDRWILHKKVDGVEFYIKHASSPYDTRFNTLVRLRNTNMYEVKVAFKPTFTCEETNETSEKGLIQTAIYPRHSVTLLAYRPCQGQIPSEIVFAELDVRKR